MSDGNPHAVRWARRTVRNEYEWTRWHWTKDTLLTLCDVPIALANEGGTFLPDTDDDINVVDCKRCLRRVRSIRGRPNL